MATAKECTNFRISKALWKRLANLRITNVLVAAAILSVTPGLHAGITRIQIISRGPAFGGYSFPKVGTYERIIGKGFGEISPTDRHNNLIVDLGLAPHNANGK